MPAAQGQGNQSPARGIPLPAKGRRPENTWQPWPLLTESQIEASPSFKLGMTFKAEKKLRDAACSVISDAGLPPQVQCVSSLERKGLMEARESLWFLNVEERIGFKDH